MKNVSNRVDQACPYTEDGDNRRGQTSDSTDSGFLTLGE